MTVIWGGGGGGDRIFKSGEKNKNKNEINKEEILAQNSANSVNPSKMADTRT